jgi:DNA-binding NarL/FixJ family response regulator
MTKLLGWTWGDPVQTHDGFPIHLTTRQREVLMLLCEGLPNKLIGRRLGLSDATVKCHVASVLRSLNVSTRLEAVAVSIQLGLVRPCVRFPSVRPHRDDDPLDGFGEAVAA